MHEQTPVVSIVTVVRNEAERLRRTMESVALRKGAAVEYLVIDGASSDGTLAVLDEFPGLVDRWVSEPDEGIYDAMNKGARLCRGTFVMFLNAGDELLVDVAELLQGAPAAAVMVYGQANMLSPTGTLVHVMGKRLKSPYRFMKGMPLCHQAILYRREQLPLYDISFKIMGDRLLTYELVREYGVARTHFFATALVNYYKDGYSNKVSDRAWHLEQNRFYRVTGNRHYMVRKAINLLFKRYVRSPLSGFFAGRSGRTPGD